MRAAEGVAKTCAGIISFEVCTLTSAAALPALAVPAAAACVEPDPIYAAIEACLEAERIYAEARARFEQARDRFTEKEGTNLTHSPKPLAKAGPEHEWLKEFSKAGCDSHQTVDRLIDDMCRKGGKDLEGSRTTSMKNLIGKRLQTTNRQAARRCKYRGL
jgi:hypothetical protein